MEVMMSKQSKLEWLVNEKSSNENSVILFLVFLVLKLTGNIDWSWWWVTFPLWLPLLTIFFVGGIGVLIKVLIKRFKGGDNE
jgi:hypothetical protein